MASSDYPTCRSEQREETVARLERLLARNKEEQAKLEAALRFATANPDALALLEHLR